MKLFTKEINDKLFKQYPLGSDLSNQMVVAKIFNPYGKGIWFLINSDPNDPDYIWAIVSLDEVEAGSVSRRDLEQTRIGGWRLPLERDSGFRPTPALEVLKGARMGNRFDMGGSVKSNDLVGKYVWVYTLGVAEPSDNKIVSVSYSDPKFNTKSIRMTFSDGAEEWIYGQDKINDFLSGRMVNLRDTTGEQYGLKLAPVYAEGGGVGDDSVLMVASQAKEAKHHADELHNALKGEKHLDSWVVSKMERATTDLSDVTHYIDGKKEYAEGGNVVNHSITLNDLIGKYFDIEVGSSIGGFTSKNWDKENLIKEITNALFHYLFDREFYYNWIDSNEKKEYLQVFKEDTLNPMIQDIDNTLNKYFAFVKRGPKEVLFFKPIGKQAWIDNWFNVNKNISKKLKEDYRNYRIEYAGVTPYSKGGKTIKGGMVKFDDKVNAISKRLVGTKVKGKYKKEYGATYDKKEAGVAATKIAGAMRAKEILAKRKKK